jgi:hypothetical protein
VAAGGPSFNKEDMMGVRSTPADATSKWVSHLSAATQEITTGVNNVTVSPGASAAAKFNKWVASMTDPGIQQKWKTNVGAVTLQQWQTSMTTIGIPRIAAGAQAKQGKYQDFATQFFPFLERGMATVNAMDDTSFAARVQKAVAMMTYNHGFVRSGG